MKTDFKCMYLIDDRLYKKKILQENLHQNNHYIIQPQTGCVKTPVPTRSFDNHAAQEYHPKHVIVNQSDKFSDKNKIEKEDGVVKISMSSQTPVNKLKYEDNDDDEHISVCKTFGNVSEENITQPQPTNCCNKKNDTSSMDIGVDSGVDGECDTCMAEAPTYQPESNTPNLIGHENKRSKKYRTLGKNKPYTKSPKQLLKTRTNKIKHKDNSILQSYNEKNSDDEEEVQKMLEILNKLRYDNNFPPKTNPKQKIHFPLTTSLKRKALEQPEGECDNKVLKIEKNAGAYPIKPITNRRKSQTYIPSINQSVVTYMCTICNTEFKSQKVLSNHVERYHSEFFDEYKRGVKREQNEEPKDVYKKRLRGETKPAIVYRNYFS